ncbi:MAG: J domain-containing protein, partial [Legionella sp.]
MIPPEELNQIRAKFQRLVEQYAVYNEQEKVYKGPKLKQETLLKLDGQFQSLLNQTLLAEGIPPEAISRQYKKLSLLFHPDKLKDKTINFPEFLWLENQLSEAENNGICFKTLSMCRDKLIDPDEFKKKNNLNDFQQTRNWKQWLEKQRNNANTYTSKYMYTCLIDLAEQSGGYFEQTGKIKVWYLRELLKMVPLLLTGYGGILLIDKILAVYALSYALTISGQQLEKSDFVEIQNLGRSLENLSSNSTQIATIILARLVEVIFWTSTKCYIGSLQIGATLLTPLLSAPKSDNNLALIVPGENHFIERQFNHPQLKLIASPLEYYLYLNAQQFFKPLRVGADKRKAIKAILSDMQIIDVSQDELGIKLLKVKQLLINTKNDSSIYNSNTKIAIDQCLNLIEGLT